MRVGSPARPVFLLAAVLLLAGVDRAHAVDRFVDCVGGNDQAGANTCTTAGPGNACKTIAQGAAQSVAGDVLHVVSNSTCAEHNVVVTAAINITGPGPSAPVVMDCTGGRCFNLSAPVVLQYLTLTHGNANLGGCVLAYKDTTMINVSLSNCQSSGDGGAVSVATGAGLMVVGGTFMNNRANGKGGVFSAISPYTAATKNWTITGSHFISNTGGEGGAILFGGVSSYLYVTASTFTGCASTGGNGGAIDLLGNGNAVIGGSTFTGNSADCNGGALYSYDAHGISVINSSFVNNFGIYGGAAHLEGHGHLTLLTIVGVTLRANTGILGGAAYFDGIQGTLNNTVFASNLGRCGGGFYTCSFPLTTTLNFANALFIGNSAQSSGGAMEMATGTVSFVNSKLFNNTAPSVGGAVAMVGTGPTNTAQLTLADSEVSGNTVPSGKGGGLWVYHDAFVTLTGSYVTMVGNSASDGGGAMDILNSLKTTGAVHVNFTRNIAGNAGGALWMSCGTPTTFSFSTASSFYFGYNTAGGVGGAISTRSALTMYNAVFVGNQAGVTGGAVEVENNQLFTITNVTFIANNATMSDNVFDCGGYVANGLALKGSVYICGNSALNDTSNLCAPTIGGTRVAMFECPICDCGGLGMCDYNVGVCACNARSYNADNTCVLGNAPALVNTVTLSNVLVTRITVGWSIPASVGTVVLNYTLERSQGDANNFAVIATLNSPSTSYNDTGLTASTQYFYRVNSCNRFGCTAFGAAASTTTQATGPSLYVDCVSGNDNSGSNNCVVQGTPCLTITQAVAKAGNDYVIHVLNGPCTETSIVPQSEISIIGSNPSVPVVMDCSGGRCFTSNYDLTIMYMHLMFGEASDNGGAIQSCANLLLDTVTVSNSSSDGCGGAIYVRRPNGAPNKHVHLLRSTLNCNYAGNGGGALYIESNPPSETSVPECHVIQDCVFAANTASNAGGSINLDQGTVTITNTKIVDSIAQGAQGGGIFACATTVIMNGCTVSGNQAQRDSGGGVSVVLGVAMITDTIVRQSSAFYDGGGVYACLSPLTLVNTWLIDNTASHSAGGLKVDTVPLSVTGGGIVGNTAGNYGGGAYLRIATDAVFTGVVLADNYADSHGGAIYAQCVPVSLLNSTVRGNGAYNGYGGAVFIDNASSARFNDTLFRDNYVGDGGGDDRGGALFVDTSIVTNTPVTFGGKWVTFANNSAPGAGGAVASNSNLYKSNSTLLTFDGNRAKNGGALYLDVVTTMITLDGVVFKNNYAEIEGGAILLDNMQQMTLTNPVFQSNSAGAGGPSILRCVAGISSSLHLANPGGCDNSVPLITPVTGCAVFVDGVSQSGDIQVGCPGCCGGPSGGTCGYTTHTCTCAALFIPYGDTCVGGPDVMDLQLIPAVTSVALSWSDPNLSDPFSRLPPLNYTVQRSSPDASHFVNVGSTLNNLTFTYTDTSLTRSTTYYYRIYSCNVALCAYGDAVSTTTLPTVPDAVVAAPTFASGQTTSTSAQVQWNAPLYTGGNITAYIVRLSDSSTRPMPWQCVICAADKHTTTTATLTTLLVNATYFVVVDACNAVGCSTDSPVAMVTTLPPPPMTTSTTTTATSSPPTSSSGDSSGTTTSPTASAVVTGDGGSSGGFGGGALAGVIIGSIVLVAILVVAVVVINRRKQPSSGGESGGRRSAPSNSSPESGSVKLTATEMTPVAPTATPAPPPQQFTDKPLDAPPSEAPAPMAV